MRLISADWTADMNGNRVGASSKERGSVLLVGEPLTVYAQPDLSKDDRESLDARLPELARDSLLRLAERRAKASPASPGQPAKGSGSDGA